jgi:hypothetical protein
MQQARAVGTEGNLCSTSAVRDGPVTVITRDPELLACLVALGFRPLLPPRVGHAVVPP